MYLGDQKQTPVTRFLRLSPNNNDGDCSLDKNINSTRESILLMKNERQRYSFILYTNDARATPPLRAVDAVNELDEIRPKENEKTNQTAAIEQFAKHSKRPDDLLVHYIPCNFNYRMEDDDTKTITAALNKYGEESKILVVSNTQPEEVLTKTFNQSKENVGFVGKNEEVNVATRIAKFGE
ncbi:hypothetical protein NECAME_08873 [Necator americanus]|uniref:Uncharacterized protein n=1 Tax=Necator americanus TaxID=51031 RepID=W2TIE3_NECAM|nr:hypothetical protein NECAME_08873 [Necator americanus]ETN80941.1 hypothetical protein NECAME_08873 [Necator americanus]